MFDRLMKINKYRAAFYENYNLIGLAIAAGASFATLNPIPAIIGIVAEASYMLFVPDTKWFEERLAAKYDVEIKEQRSSMKERILPQLNSEMRHRFEALEAARENIGVQAGLTDEVWFREVLRKLDFLLDKFLDFGLREVQFRKYLDTAVSRVGTDHMYTQSGRKKKQTTSSEINDSVLIVESYYDKEIAELEAQLAEAESEENDSTTAILRKRCEVILRRRNSVSRIGKLLNNLSHQLELLEETFGLIGDEILARTPDQVLSDIDEVVSQTNAMTTLLEEMAPFERSLSQM